ncbi:hypothetical protein DEU56DRAFT_816854 [Suillus clintonianus]|uniref:uncharacterized protein n=1 Tax=Suillus clintonianus TaxID=1904413 RepID=UPI001B87876E|nr:uncharacterized protein DEU56DRAFT_816854 [Suillus clintonianus]KAG2129583.1 hypothetical protein DEU56DRAFT_816854 [Suillus clintonianus]
MGQLFGTFQGPNYAQSLPPELWQHCLSFLAVEDLLAVSSTCLSFHFICKRMLFRHITTTIPYKRTVRHIFQPRYGDVARIGRARRLLHRIHALQSDNDAQEVLGLVETWSIRTFGSPAPLEAADIMQYAIDCLPFVQSSTSIFLILPSCINLRMLSISDIYMGEEQWSALVKIPQLECLNMERCNLTYGGEVMKLKVVSIIHEAHHDPPLVLPPTTQLISSLFNLRHLERLTLLDLTFSNSFLIGLAQVGQFENLKHLSVVVPETHMDTMFTFLSRTPSITSLTISNFSTMAEPSMPVSQFVVPNLVAYDGFPTLLPILLPGRPISTVRLRMNHRTDPQASLGDPFGVYDNNVICKALNDCSTSTRVVHDLMLSPFHPTPDSMQDIVRIHPDLRHLRLDILRTPNINMGVDVDEPMSRIMDMLADTMEAQSSDNISNHPLFLISGFLNWIANGHLPLPTKLETLHLHYYQKSETVCGNTAKQRLLVPKISAAYPALHEIEMGTTRWWREGDRWSHEVLTRTQL